jgi:hypothetical protein
VGKTLTSGAVFALFVVFYVHGAGFAAAATNAEKAREVGLIGKWAVGEAEGLCSQTPNLSTGFYTYVVSGNDVLLNRDFGADGKDSNKVLRIEMVGDLVEVEIRFANIKNSVTRVFAYKNEGNRMRVKYNRTVDGDYSVKDFVLVGSDRETPWNMRCP